MKVSRRTLLVASLALASGAAGCAILEAKESEWIFRPTREDWRGFAGAPAEFTERYLPVGKGGEQIHTWWLQHPDRNAPAILYLHGARWNLTGSVYRIHRWRDMGFSVLAIDYRGFGKSSGSAPTETLAYEDARIAWEHLKTLMPNAKQRFLYGHSLGGAVAVHIATELAERQEAAGGLILESTFTSIRDLTTAYGYGWVPVGLVQTQRFESLEKIERVKLPLLLLHGTADRVIPHHMSEALHARAHAREPGRKKLVIIEGGGHSNLSWNGGPTYTEAVRQFVAQSLAL